mmetsp:Transcript_35969/g.32354  ORF Transcript_35969/g.32354 Transcript_35969/m.32354 type:complete len:181 (+) Transcript_35969:503-1045(+)
MDSQFYDFEKEYVLGLEEEEDLKYRYDPRYSHVKGVIFPDDAFKGVWEIIIAVNLLYTAIFIPYQLAFLEDDILWVNILSYISDIIWALDIILNFLFAYEDKDDNLVYSHKKIALNYVTGWFIIDLLSVFPFEWVFNTSSSYNSLVRLSRLPKLTKFVRLTKFARMLKFMRKENKISLYM